MSDLVQKYVDLIDLNGIGFRPEHWRQGAFFATILTYGSDERINHFILGDGWTFWFGGFDACT